MEGSNPTVFTSDNVPQAPEDPLFGLMAAYRKDTFEKKVDLGIGAYRDDNAKPWVLPVVKKVTKDPGGRSRTHIDQHTGRSYPTKRPQPQPRISSNRWLSGLHIGSSETCLGRRQLCNQR